MGESNSGACEETNIFIFKWGRDTARESSKTERTHHRRFSVAVDGECSLKQERAGEGEGTKLKIEEEDEQPGAEKRKTKK